MQLSEKAQSYYAQITPETKLGDIRKMAKTIKRDHELGLELWNTENFFARQLAILILDKRLLTQEVLDTLFQDMKSHEYQQANHMADWLMANQLMKDKNAISLMESWENSALALQRRIYWYYQARLRWMGKTEFDNTEYLVSKIETNLLKEAPEVQWAMNFTAGQIGKFVEVYRERCIAIGTDTGLYKEEKAPKGCTPNYLPKFIEMEVAKLNK